MKIPQDAICSVCKRIFCCGKCREKHEIKNHSIRIRRTHAEASANKEKSVDFVFVLCPICLNKPFPLREIMCVEILEHVRSAHLPLHCQKCAKVYTKIDDLREFSKCVQPLPCENGTTPNNQAIQNLSCVLKTASKTSSQQNTISTQTSPHLAGASSIMPTSIVNWQWKAKSKVTQDISDNTSSLKNLSLISNSTSQRCSSGSMTQIEAKGKLVRTTSTPLYNGSEYVKPKEQTFNVSGGQVSSIYNSGCESENQNSPIFINVAVAGSSTSTHPQPDAVNLYKKFNGRTKIAAVTPLRQVMSKSIQKAFAEHGLPSFSEQKAIGQKDALDAISDALSAGPLDLRLSPALRRSKSESFGATKTKYTEEVSREAKCQKLTATPRKQHVFQKCLIAGNHLRTESIMITRTKQLEFYQTSVDQLSSETSASCSTVNSISSDSIYKTCQSFEIIRSELSATQNTFNNSARNDKSGSSKFNRSNGNNSTNLASITPITSLPGSSIKKKLIQFETPRIENVSKSPIAEKFYTPISSPGLGSEYVPDDLNKLSVVQNLSTRYSPQCRSSMGNCAQSTAYSHHEVEADDADSNDEVFAAETEVKLRSAGKTQTGAIPILKSIFDSVLRLPSFREKSNLIKQRPAIHAKTTKKTSIIKRCASIAGSLVRSRSLMDENQLQTLKRKRTHTIDSQINSYKSIFSLESVSSSESVAAGRVSTSTKRFRIHGRKPIERMRDTSS